MKVKSSFDDIISAAANFFDQWDPSTASSIKEVCSQQDGTMLKYKPHLFTFHENILVSW